MEVLHKLLGIIKEKVNGQERKKLLQNAAIVIIIGIVLIIAGSSFFSNGEKKKEEPIGTDKTFVEAESRGVVSNDSDQLEERMEKILSQIKGVGKVKVMVTYSSSKEMVPATDLKRSDSDTDERDKDGGTRKITQEDLEKKVVYQDDDGGKKPVIVKEMLPTIKGVVIVADGASDVLVKESLLNAAKVLMGIEPHRIQVFERNK